jgi:hypothetical protein
LKIRHRKAKGEGRKDLKGAEFKIAKFYTEISRMPTFESVITKATGHRSSSARRQSIAECGWTKLQISAGQNQSSGKSGVIFE